MATTKTPITADAIPVGLYSLTYIHPYQGDAWPMHLRIDTQRDNEGFFVITNCSGSTAAVWDFQSWLNANNHRRAFQAWAEKMILSQLNDNR
jgi:hypothetical protein